MVGQAWTLMVIRRDDRGAADSQLAVFIYYLETNIRLSEAGAAADGAIGDEGTVVLDYVGCDAIGLSESSSPNFYLLLLEQPDPETSIPPPNDLIDTSCPTVGSALRCRFPLSRFIADNQLRLVGLSRWRVEAAPFTGARAIPSLPRWRKRFRKRFS